MSQCTIACYFISSYYELTLEIFKHISKSKKCRKNFQFLWYFLSYANLFTGLSVPFEATAYL
jgi:hypothetical protein